MLGWSLLYDGLCPLTFGARLIGMKHWVRYYGLGLMCGLGMILRVGPLIWMVCGILENPLTFVPTVLCFNILGTFSSKGNEPVWSHSTPSILFLLLFDFIMMLRIIIVWLNWNKLVVFFGVWKIKIVSIFLGTLHKQDRCSPRWTARPDKSLV